MKKLTITLSLVLLLAGCASKVKLNDVPVEDKSGSSVSLDAGAAGQAQSAVAPVEVGKLGGVDPGPVGVGKIVYFDYDSFSIKPEFQAVIEAHAKYLRADAKRRVNLEGHTDERGGREYNLALGQKRSEAVRKALTLLGVNDAQMDAVSFGKEKPAASGSDEAAFAKNRRVEVTYR